MREVNEVLQRILKNMYANTMIEAQELGKLSAKIIKEEQNNSDWRWNYISILAMIYLYGKEEGIRSERAKKKAANCN